MVDSKELNDQMNFLSKELEDTKEKLSTFVNSILNGYSEEQMTEILKDDNAKKAFAELDKIMKTR